MKTINELSNAEIASKLGIEQPSVSADMQKTKMHGSVTGVIKFAEALGVDEKSMQLLRKLVQDHMSGQRPSTLTMRAATNVLLALIDADRATTTNAIRYLSSVEAEQPKESSVNESIRAVKESAIDECFGDMQAVAMPQLGGTPTPEELPEEPMSVQITMPGKNISVTTDSADEIMNILKLAGLAVNKSDAVDGLDNDKDGDHDMADHKAEEEPEEEEPVEESNLANSPANTSMPEPTMFGNLPSNRGTGAGNKEFGRNRADGQGDNPMGNVEEAFQSAMSEYRKFVSENLAKKA